MNVAVIGGGIFGMASALEITLRGHKTTIFEKESIPATNASSTDVSKGIRRTWYGDDGIYVDLVEQAADKWREWEKSFNSRIYHQTGSYLILTSLEPGTPMHNSIKVLKDRGTKLEILSAKEGKAKFPQINTFQDEICVHDPWGGYIESGSAIRHLLSLALELKINVFEGHEISAIEDLGDSVSVTSGNLSMRFDRVVVAAGAWIANLLPSIGSSMRVTQQEMLFIKVPDSNAFSRKVMPVWSVEPDSDGWYGFPVLKEGYTKLAREPLGEIVDPDVGRSGTRDFKSQAIDFMTARIPGMAEGKIVGGRKCLYTNTPDDHFAIDWMPGSQTMILAGGGSGHGFKFGGVIGELVADVLEERYQPKLDLFRIGDRFSSDKIYRPENQTRGFATERKQQ